MTCAPLRSSFLPCCPTACICDGSGTHLRRRCWRMDPPCTISLSLSWSLPEAHGLSLLSSSNVHYGQIHRCRVKPFLAGAPIPAASRLRQGGLHPAQENFRDGSLPQSVVRDAPRARLRGGLPGTTPCIHMLRTHMFDFDTLRSSSHLCTRAYLVHLFQS